MSLEPLTPTRLMPSTSLSHLHTLRPQPLKSQWPQSLDWSRDCGHWDFNGWGRNVWRWLRLVDGISRVGVSGSRLIGPHIGTESSSISDVVHSSVQALGISVAGKRQRK